MTGPTYYDRLKGEDTRPVEELCQPLSAKVMPRIAGLSLHGTLTEQQAIAAQRRMTRQTNNGGKARAKKGGKP